MRAIDGDKLIKALIRKEPFNDCARVVIAECIEEVRHAPTIEPERKKGHWKLLKDGSAICSVCKFSHECVWDTDKWDNFCRYCGADMR